MKKFLLFFAVFGLLSLTTATAQKTCTASKTAKNGKVCSKTAAAKLASMDASIEKRVCEKSGSVSYVRKNVCSASGKVSFNDVEYCTKSAKFVNVSPSQGVTTKKSCTKSKAACAKKAGASGSAMQVSNETSGGAKKAACTKGKAACCAKGAKGVKATTKASKAKLVKNEE